MIAFVQGTLSEQGHDHILLDTGGIGYRLFVPLRTLAELGPVGSRIQLRTRLEVREDSWTLYGFRTADEVTMFEHLTSVTGVGPKMAMGVLSVHTVPEIARGIAEGDEKMFTRVSGVGKKTAARLLLELGEKVRRFLQVPVPGPRGASPRVAAAGPAAEVRLALESLGFQGAEVEAALEAAEAAEGAEASAQALLRSALAHFRRA